MLEAANMEFDILNSNDITRTLHENDSVNALKYELF